MMANEKLHIRWQQVALRTPELATASTAPAAFARHKLWVQRLRRRTHLPGPRSVMGTKEILPRFHNKKRTTLAAWHRRDLGLPGARVRSTWGTMSVMPHDRGLARMAGIVSISRCLERLHPVHGAGQPAVLQPRLLWIYPRGTRENPP